MKHLFIVNPTAGGSDKTDLVGARVRSAFAHRHDEPYEIYVTKAPLDATRRVREAGESGEHVRVYACGGDGTFNEVASGAVGYDNLAVCPFPTGTGNDFCRMFGEESEVFRDLDALVGGREVPIDIIACNDRYSVNICSVGIDARIGTNVHRYSALPLVGGATAYVLSAVVEMCKGISRPMRITAPGFDERGEFTLACVCNGRYYGGGFNPSLDARPDDGELDMFIVRKVNLPQFAALIGKYAKGQAAQMEKYITHVKGEYMTIEFDEESVINLDGEAYTAKRAEMRLIRNGVKLLVPQGMKFFA